MPVMSVALENGFEGDAVEIRVGEQVVRRPDVRTRTVVGFAEVVDIPVPDGDWPVQIRLPERHLRTDLNVAVADADVHVRVIVAGQSLTAEIVDQHRYG